MKVTIKAIVRVWVQVACIPFLPLLAVGWWLGSEDSYWQSLKKVWEL